MKNKKKSIQKKVIRSEKRKPQIKEEENSEMITLKVKAKPSFEQKDSRITKTKQERKYH